MASLPINPEPIADLSDLIYPHEWSVYRDVIEAAAWQNLRFCLGGGLAFSAYCERRRGMKDIDLFILREEKEAFIELLCGAGYEDYYDREPYDRTWIYRGYLDKVVLDLIWSLPNHRIDVTSDWFERGLTASVHGQQVHLIPVEEVIRSKIYVLQHDRCDWPDLLNILDHQAENFNWHVLLQGLGEDARLFGALLCTYGWLNPAGARRIPPFVWQACGAMVPDEVETEHRAHLLDTRDWFGEGEDAAREL